MNLERDRSAMAMAMGSQRSTIKELKMHDVTSDTAQKMPWEFHLIDCLNHLFHYRDIDETCLKQLSQR